MMECPVQCGRNAHVSKCLSWMVMRQLQQSGALRANRENCRLLLWLPMLLQKTYSLQKIQAWMDISQNRWIWISWMMFWKAGCNRIIGALKFPLYKSWIKYYDREKYLQGRVQFPTGGKAREPRGMIRWDSGADSTVWMEEDDSTVDFQINECSIDALRW